VDMELADEVKANRVREESFKRIIRTLISINRNLCDIVKKHATDEDDLNMVATTIEVMDKTEFDLEDL